MADVSASSSSCRRNFSDYVLCFLSQMVTGMSGTGAEMREGGMGDMGDGMTAGIDDRKMTDALVRTKASQLVLVRNAVKLPQPAHQRTETYLCLPLLLP